MILTTDGVTQSPVTKNGKNNYNLTKNGVDTLPLHIAINGVVQLPPS